jgi:hypothetical protein
MTNKEKGTKLEQIVSAKLRDALRDYSIRPSKASGGGSHNSEQGDIYNLSDLIIECKNLNDKSENIIFDMKVWNKLLNELSLGSTKKAIYIKQHNGEIFCMLTLDDLCRLIKDDK